MGEQTAGDLTGDTAAWGGAVAYRAQPCLVFYGVPVWIMPNGKCRVGAPDAPMLDTNDAIAKVVELRGGGYCKAVENVIERIEVLGKVH